MRIHPDVVAASSERIDRSHTPQLRARTAAVPTQLAPERLARVESYINEYRMPDDTFALERAIGTNDLLSIFYFWAGLRAARSVGLIQIAPGPGDRGGVATGFMIAPNLLLTNWHVFETADSARRARVKFAYEADADGNERVSTSFSFVVDASNGFFINDKTLDYAIVAVDPGSKQGPDNLASFGWLRLNPRLGKTDYGQYLSIIQHPSGQTKQIAIRENKLLPFDDADDFLTYQSDTFRGSSGSPVFNDLWDVVALHHSGKPLKDAQGRYIGHDGKPIVDRNPNEDEVQWIANEGARTSRIVADFLRRAPAGAARQAFEASAQGTVRPIASKLELLVEPDRQPPRVEVPRTLSSGLPERGFALILPLNVGLRVESLAEPPQLPVALPAAGAPTAPAVVRTVDAIEIEKLNFDFDYTNRRGYDPEFLGRERVVAMPSIEAASDSQIAPLRRGRGKVLHYHHYSAMVHADRRMPVLSACNVDYSAGKRKVKGREKFGKDEWVADGRMDDQYQLPKGFYDRWKKLDYGHLVRRDDNCWGSSKKEIEYANSDTFHLTNCTPQHESFNRAIFGYQGVWGRLEVHISDQAEQDEQLARLCVLAGPIFGKKDLVLNDEEAGKVHVPLAFWKVVVAPTQRGGLRAFGFITSQKQDLDDDPPFEEFTPEGFEDEQAELSKIEERTIVRFSRDLKKIDAMRDHPDGRELLPLETLEQMWMGK